MASVSSLILHWCSCNAVTTQNKILVVAGRSSQGSIACIPKLQSSFIQESSWNQEIFKTSNYCNNYCYHIKLCEGYIWRWFMYVSIIALYFYYCFSPPPRYTIRLLLDISHVSVNLQLTPLLDIWGIRLLRGNNPSSSSASKNSSSSNVSTSRIPLSSRDMNVASSSVGKNYNHTICH